MKKLALAVVCTSAFVSLLTAEEFNAVIIEVKGTKVGYFKSKEFGPGEFYPKPTQKTNPNKGIFSRNWIITEVSATVRIARGTYNKKEDKYAIGELIEGGLAADIFKNIWQDDGIRTIGARITVADDGEDKGKITQILTRTTKSPKKKVDVPLTAKLCTIN